MRIEFVIVGLILVIAGVGVGIYGYKQTQPSKIEKVAKGLGEFVEGLSGEKMPPMPKRDTKSGTVMMIVGGVLFLVGIGTLLKSGKESVYVPPPKKEEGQIKEKTFCQKCGAKLSSEDNFCPECGTKIG